MAYGCNPKRELPKEGEDPINVIILDMGHSNLQASMCQFVKGSVKVNPFPSISRISALVASSGLWTNCEVLSTYTAVSRTVMATYT